ncbi:hypothetical protein A9K55_006872 [Cordyceps militaris]|uniref:Uncharacterized protein n=1 Tax=Cordyceps militaris TaxID=73501 RepID=A0A2H4SDP1_CORMI|nr:hypothetical protein A9K55_006872 [Cordyceps militaris]
MKTAAAAILLAAATLVVAEPQHALPPGSKINCAKANASYCMGSDIIVRCGPDALGEPARCSPGYPPADDGFHCWESSENAGDAVCRKVSTSTSTHLHLHRHDQHLGFDQRAWYYFLQRVSRPPSSSVTSSVSTSTTVATTRTPPPYGTGNLTTSIPTTTKPSTGSSTTTLTSTTGPKPPKPTTTPPISNNAVPSNAVSGLLALGLAVAALF